MSGRISLCVYRCNACSAVNVFSAFVVVSLLPLEES